MSEEINHDTLERIQELCDIKDTLVETVLSVDNRISTVNIWPDHMVLGFYEDVVIDTDLIVKLSEYIRFTSFSIKARVHDKSFLGFVTDYSTVFLELTLNFDKQCAEKKTQEKESED